MLIESNKQAATTTTSGGDQVKLTPIDQSQMIQINQIMDEMHHSIKDNNAGSGNATSNGGVQQIMLNGQPALFIPASAFGASNPMIQMNQEKQSNDSISMSLDFSALLGNENHLNTSGKEDTVKYEPIDYEDEVMSQEEQVVGNQLCNLTNIINNNTSQQSTGHQNQGVTLYQLPNGTLTTDPHAAMMAADTSAQSQQPQYLYLPLPFDGNMSTQTVMQNTQQAFMTSNGQIMNQVVSQPAATVPKDDQNEYLLSGKKKTPRTGNTIAMALSKTNPVEESAKKRNCNKKKKFVDMVVDFKMNKLSTIISQNEKQQQQQISMTVPVQTAPIVIPAPPPQPPTQPQFQLLPGQQVFFDQQSNQWYIMNGPVYGGDKPNDQSTSPKEKSKLRDKEKSMAESDDDYEDLDDDFDDDDLSDNENNTNRKEGFHGRRRKACDCANCLKFKQHPGKEAGKKRTHVCHKCPKEYNKTSHLRAHLRAHDGLRPYACDFRSCGKMFTRSDELKRHKRIHTDERKFACAVCKKKFLRSDHLSKHMLIHIKHSKDLPQEVLATLQKTPNPADKRKPSNAQVKIKTLLLADEETKKNSQQHQQTHDSATPTAITLPNGTTAFISAMSALNSTIFP